MKQEDKIRELEFLVSQQSLQIGLLLERTEKKKIFAFSWKAVGLFLVLFTGSALGSQFASKVRADGTNNPLLYYSGTAEKDGQPLTGPHDIVV